MSVFEKMSNKQKEIENLKRYLKDLGLNETHIGKIANGENHSKKSSTVKCRVILDIEISKDIEKKYPNFMWNYSSKTDFLNNCVSWLNHNISLDECLVYKNLHPHFENPNYEMYDDGYKQTVKKIEFL